MKKLIALLVVFALLAGSVFAIDVSGGVIGTVKLLEGNSVKTADREGNEVSDIGAGGAMGRIRLEGSGEAGDNFGGWLRIEGAAFNEKAIMGAVAAFMPDDPTAGGGTDPDDESAPGLEISDLFNAGFYGIAWWKPIDQLKVSIGGNPDGHWGKDGVARWGFYLDAGDAGVAAESWAFDASFFGGFFDPTALMFEITPMDMLAINIGIPFSRGKLYSEDLSGIKEVYLKAVAQFVLNLDFGTIALTYKGGTNDKYKVGYEADLTDPTDPKIDRSSDPSKVYAYFGLTMIDNLGIDVGIGFPFPNKGDKDTNDVTIQEPIAAGLGVSFATDMFGVKFRTQGTFGGGVTVGDGDKAKDPFVLDLDVLPYYVMNDNMSIFLSAGLKMTVPDEGDSVLGFHINPYIQVGGAGPAFWAGFRLWTDGVKGKDSSDPDKTVMEWAVPIGLTVSF